MIESEVYPMSKSLTDSLEAEFTNKGTLEVSYDHLKAVANTNNKIHDTKAKIVDYYATMVDKGIITSQEANKKLTELGVL